MAQDGRRPPRGKIKPRTPVPTATRPPAPSPGAGPRRAFTRTKTFGVPIVALVMAIGLGIVLGLRSSSTTDRGPTPTTTETTPTESSPTVATRETAAALFGHTCASCHTLAAAGATGGIGPNLDELRPTRARVRSTIRTGSLSGAMPANLLVGDDAERVAAYVARVAGR